MAQGRHILGCLLGCRLGLLESLFALPHVDVDVFERRQRAGVVVLLIRGEQLLAVLERQRLAVDVLDLLEPRRELVVLLEDVTIP